MYTHTHLHMHTHTCSTHLHTLWVTQILLQSTIIIATTWTHSSHYIGHAAASWPPNLSSKQQASQAHTHNIIILLSNLHVALIFFLSPWLHSPKYCNSIPENFCWTEILPYPPAFALKITIISMKSSTLGMGGGIHGMKNFIDESRGWKGQQKFSSRQ